MCGAAGWVDFTRDMRGESVAAQAMTDSMACRGPDAEGSWLSEDAAIVHRRLAVIDLEGGAQPMVEGGRGRSGQSGDEVVLSYTGEVYNYRELRQELEGRGNHTFHTSSDTEVVLHAYLEWGPACVERFVGMFAFAVWDARRRELLLARDRLGVKPMYYSAWDGGVVFGSEPKALLASGHFEAVLDDQGITELFAMFGTASPGYGGLRNLSEVRPGHVVVFGAAGQREHRYWQLVSREHEDDAATTAATVYELLRDAVEGQLVSDVPLCALVSGGIDSSAVAALASTALDGHGDKLHTFSVDFAEGAERFLADTNRPALDAPFVELLVQTIGSVHTDVVLDTRDLLELQRRATQARDLPSMGDLDTSLYLLFAAIQGQSTVALSGEAADEVFGGYAWFHDAQAHRRPGFPWTPNDLGLANVLSDELRARLQPEDYVRSRYADALAEVPRLPGEPAVEARRRELSYLGLTRFMPVLLNRKDRMSMAVGLEVRVPFCDHRLVEYAWNIPWDVKCVGNEPKGMLRQAVAPLLPPELVHRAKAMYPVTIDSVYDTAVRSQALDLLESGSAVSQLLDTDRVLDLVSGTSQRPAWMQRLALAYLGQVGHWFDSYDIRLA